MKHYTCTRGFFSGETIQFFRVEIIFYNEDVNSRKLKVTKRSKKISNFSEKMKGVELMHSG